MRILLLNLSAESLLEANNALAGQGYEVSTEIGLNIDQVLALTPEVLVTEATSADLTCAGLISALKARPDIRPLKIVTIVPGGATERAHLLDLGADDAVSLPLDGAEFAARIRTQFRERQGELEMQTMLKYATQRENIADLAVESLNTDLVTKRRRWLLPAIFAVSAAAIIASVSMLVTTRRSRKDNLQLRAEIARLNYGIGQQQTDILQRTQALRESIESQANSTSATRDSLVARSADIKKKMVAASGDASESASLKQQLADTQTRLKALETEGKVAETVVHNYSPSVCLLHVVVEFLDRQTGRPIQIAVDGLGKPIVDEQGMVQLDSGGPGPHLQIDVFGTGFLVRKDGRIVTNHHVAEPWWNNDELKDLIDRGASAYVISYRAYFPGSTDGIPAKLDKISSNADVAVLRLEAPAPPKATLLELDDRHEATVSGDPVVLIGYPTGIEGILARAGNDVAQKITDTKSVTRIVSQLASEQLIRPTTTQGHIGDILQDKIVYDAATTSGGSGGPLFNRSGKVIGVNFAILKGFGGSNLAVPVRYANELLK
jgi:S1-C subfamily serine protease